MNLVLSGATGYIGKHLAAALLEAGHRLTLLVRAGHRDPETRAAAALSTCSGGRGIRAHGALRVLRADLSEPDCGLTRSSLAELGSDRFDGFIHCAGLTRFEEHLSEALMRTNLDGTRRAFDLCERLAVPRFHHLSTAYVAGRAARPFGADDLDVGQAFNNPYERSKFAAESYLRARAGRTGTAITIYRPSIVVGGCPLGEDNNASTLYAFIKAVHFIRECCRRDDEQGRRSFAAFGVERRGERFRIPIRVAADPHCRVNLIAIEDVVECVLSELERGAGELQSIHICGEDHRLHTLRRAIVDTLHVSGTRLVQPPAFAYRPRNVLEQRFHRMTRSYQPYLFHAPRFAGNRHPPRHRIDAAALTRRFLAQMGRPAPGRRRGGVGSLALAALGVSRPGDYFDALVSGDVGRRFLVRHDFIDARIRFCVSGSRALDVVVHFRDGAARYLGGAADQAPDCRYEIDETLFMRIIRGEADLRQAFLAGQVQVSGDKELALKFGALFGMYYRNIDDEAIEECVA